MAITSEILIFSLRYTNIIRMFHIIGLRHFLFDFGDDQIENTRENLHFSLDVQKFQLEHYQFT